MEDLRPLNWLINHDVSLDIRKPVLKKKSLEWILRNGREAIEKAKSNPTLRPPLSYSTLILLALQSTPGKKLPLSGIYKWIKTTFNFYMNSSGKFGTAWKNSIRHNLSLNKIFIKVPRSEKGGKGSLWTLDPELEIKLRNGENFYRLRKRRVKKKSSSSSSSPTGGNINSNSMDGLEDQQQGVVQREETLSPDGQEVLYVEDLDLCGLDVEWTFDLSGEKDGVLEIDLDGWDGTFVV